MADPGSAGDPNPKGAESYEMARWQGSLETNVRDNTRRLDAINGDLDQITEALERIRSDVRSLTEKLQRVGKTVDRVESGQAVIHTDTAGIDWKTVLAVVTGVTVPIATVIIATGGGG